MNKCNEIRKKLCRSKRIVANKKIKEREKERKVEKKQSRENIIKPMIFEKKSSCNFSRRRGREVKVERKDIKD